MGLNDVELNDQESEPDDETDEVAGYFGERKETKEMEDSLDDTTESTV